MFREIEVTSKTLTVLSLPDRRTSADESVEWLLQSELEALLFRHRSGACESTGAAYRLISQRTIRASSTRSSRAPWPWPPSLRRGLWLGRQSVPETS